MTSVGDFERLLPGGFTRSDEMDASRSPTSQREFADEAHTNTKTAKGVLALPQKGFRLLDDRQIASLPTPEWLIPPLLVKDTLAVLFGPSESGKSFLARDWALSVAQGSPWLGHKTVRGPAVYIWGESVIGLSQRVLAWKRSLGLSEIENIRFLPHAVQLLDPGQVQSLLDCFATQLPAPPSLVVVDTLARCFVGGEENSAKDMGQFIAALDLIRQGTRASVLVVHHTGRQGTGERGSSALRAAADTMLSLTRHGDSLTLSCDKQKDHAPFDPIRLELEPAFDSCIVTLAEGQGLRGELTTNEDKCLQALGSLYPMRAAMRQDWQTAVGLPASTFDRAVRVLMDKGYVAQGKRRGPYILTEAGKVVLNAQDAASVNAKVEDDA